LLGGRYIETQAATTRLQAFSCCTLFESKDFAFWSSARRFALSPRPARLMKYVSIRMPDPGPFDETFLEASVFAMTGALLVNSPAGG